MEHLCAAEEAEALRQPEFGRDRSMRRQAVTVTLHRVPRREGDDVDARELEQD